MKEIPVYEEAGIICRIPNWWKNKSDALKVSVTVGNKAPSHLNFNALMDFNVELSLGLKNFLESVFQRKGLVLHGETAVAKRRAIVEKFQGPEYIPFMALSIKAGGVGLNLTAANHVIHFDRWWNPAVENQATDTQTV